MTVYHGSYEEIKEIDLSKCEPNRDFGKAFYVTNIRKQAEYWASRRGKDHGTDGFVTVYNFYDNAFEHYGLKTLRFPYYTEEWLDFVVLNRDPNSPIPAHDYDIVEGPVADDKVTRRIFAYLNGAVSKADFLEELRHSQHTHQIALCTVESFQMIEYKVNDTDLTIDEIDDLVVQALVSEGMSEAKALDAYYESKVYRQLIEDHIDLTDMTWHDIYKMLLKELK